MSPRAQKPLPKSAHDSKGRAVSHSRRAAKSHLDGAHDHHHHVHGDGGGHADVPSERAAPGAEEHREPLDEGHGRGKTLFLDAASGVAGDMTIAALVDLGVPFSVVERAVAGLSLDGVSIRVMRARALSIGATRFEVSVNGRQPERHYREVDELIRTAPIDTAVRDAARAIFRRLGEAEARVHRIPLDQVHFHEVGAADAIVDIVGAAACAAYLGAEIVCSPLPLGRGFVNSRHGTLPLPAPAALACLRGVPTFDAGIEAELVTPTGAAIVATLACRFESWPSFIPERIGWGAGTVTLPDRPNALRAVIGVPNPGLPDGEAGGDHVVVEANVDDITGELAGNAIAALLAAGALDAWATPVTMKKGRPALVMSAVARRSEVNRVAEAMLRETTSIGVRWTPAHRLERPRETRLVATRFGEIPVKVSGGPFGEPVIKPEFDACARAAERAGVSIRTVLAEAMRVASIGTF